MAVGVIETGDNRFAFTIDDFRIRTGDRIKVFNHFAFDETSTLSYTTLALKIGSGRGQKSGEIHWHIAAENEVRYASIDDKREQMLWVEVRKGDDFWRYTNWQLLGPASASLDSVVNVRILDCVDCHNRATHIYEDPEEAVDTRLTSGMISRKLPFAKRVALSALTGNYADTATAMRGINNEVRGYYLGHAREKSLAWQDEIDQMVQTLEATYRRNIHPRMNVSWGTYPDYLGHDKESGCFRCHNTNLVDVYGQAIPYDCTLCHSFLSYQSPEQFRFLKPVAENDPERKMHQYLQSEFLNE